MLCNLYMKNIFQWR